jgi:hypothetical protein
VASSLTRHRRQSRDHHLTRSLPVRARPTAPVPTSAVRLISSPCPRRGLGAGRWSSHPCVPTSAMAPRNRSLLYTIQAVHVEGPESCPIISRRRIELRANLRIIPNRLIVKSTWLEFAPAPPRVERDPSTCLEFSGSCYSLPAKAYPKRQLSSTASDGRGGRRGVEK